MRAGPERAICRTWDGLLKPDLMKAGLVTAQLKLVAVVVKLTPTVAPMPASALAIDASNLILSHARKVLRLSDLEVVRLTIQVAGTRGPALERVLEQAPKHHTRGITAVGVS